MQTHLLCPVASERFSSRCTLGKKARSHPRPENSPFVAGRSRFWSAFPRDWSRCSPPTLASPLAGSSRRSSAATPFRSRLPRRSFNFPRRGSHQVLSVLPTIDSPTRFRGPCSRSRSPWPVGGRPSVRGPSSVAAHMHATASDRRNSRRSRCCQRRSSSRMLVCLEHA